MQINPRRKGSLLYTWTMAFIVLFSIGSVGAAESTIETFDDIEAYVDGTIESQMVLKDMPAVTISVVKDGSLIFSKGYGMADTDKQIPVSAESSLFRIGSTSKLFTWTSIMQLYEQGKVDLDADVNTYIDFEIPATYEQPITLRHILTHTAGFEEGALGYLIRYYPKMGPKLEEAMKLYIPARLNPPGKVSSYSNYGTALAGLIVQNVTGQPFNQYVEEHIFQPLGMTKTTFEEPLPAKLKPLMVRGYARENGVFSEEPFEVLNSIGPAGAVSSNANDMSKFMLAHLNNGELNGKRILKADTVRLMHSKLWAGDERLSGMAHGFYERHFNGHRLIGHGGDTLQFHTDMVLDKAEDLGIFVSYMTTTDNDARNAFVKQFYDHYFPKEREHIVPPSDFASRADKYAGSFISWRRNESTIEKAASILSGPVEVAPSGNNTLVVSGAVPARQYVEVENNLFRQVDGDERLAFVENTDGDIEGLYFDSAPFVGFQAVPAFQSSFFKVQLPIICLLVMLFVFITWGYKRRAYRAATGASRGLIYSALATGAVNFLLIIFFVLIIAVYEENLYGSVPFAFKANLILPIVAVLLALLTAYFFVKRQLSEGPSLASTIWYSIVVFAGLYMAYFYYYWNFLGWNYK